MAGKGSGPRPRATTPSGRTRTSWPGRCWMRWWGPGGPGRCPGGRATRHQGLRRAAGTVRDAAASGRVTLGLVATSAAPRPPDGGHPYFAGRPLRPARGNPRICRQLGFNPLLRGATSATGAAGDDRPRLQRFNPLLRGATSATGAAGDDRPRLQRFNPLLRGATSATGGNDDGRIAAESVSIPYFAGRPLRRTKLADRVVGDRMFQSPTSRGDLCDLQRSLNPLLEFLPVSIPYFAGRPLRQLVLTVAGAQANCFNPLLRGATSATRGS